MNPTRAITVGQLRAELVGLPDNTPLVVLITSNGATRYLPVVEAGLGEGISATEDAFAGQAFPLRAEARPDVDYTR